MDILKNIPIAIAYELSQLTNVSKAISPAVSSITFEILAVCLVVRKYLSDVHMLGLLTTKLIKVVKRSSKWFFGTLSVHTHRNLVLLGAKKPQGCTLP